MVVSIEKCLENDVFYGHLSRNGNPKFSKYLYCKKDGIDIIDVEKTVAAINNVETILTNIARSGGAILFVSPQKAFRKYVEELATSLSMPYVTKKWLGGLLTNFIMYRKTIKGIENLEKFIASPDYGMLAKRERRTKEKECSKKKNMLYGIFEMYRVPAVVVVVDVKTNATAVDEAISRGIPVVGIVDTNSNPDNIDHVIPGNDDSLKSVKFILEEITKNVKKASKEYLENVAIKVVDRGNSNIAKAGVDDKKSIIDDKKSIIDDKKSVIDDKKSVIDDEKSVIDDEVKVDKNKKEDEKEGSIAAIKVRDRKKDKKSKNKKKSAKEESIAVAKIKDHKKDKKSKNEKKSIEEESIAVAKKDRKAVAKIKDSKRDKKSKNKRINVEDISIALAKIKDGKKNKKDKKK